MSLPPFGIFIFLLKIFWFLRRQHEQLSNVISRVLRFKGANSLGNITEQQFQFSVQLCFIRIYFFPFSMKVRMGQSESMSKVTSYQFQRSECVPLLLVAIGSL